MNELMEVIGDVILVLLAIVVLISVLWELI